MILFAIASDLKVNNLCDALVMWALVPHQLYMILLSVPNSNMIHFNRERKWSKYSKRHQVNQRRKNTREQQDRCGV